MPTQHFRQARKLVLRAAMLFVGLAVSAQFAVGCQLLGGGSTSISQGLQGRVVWPKDGDLWVLEMGTKEQKRITSLPPGAAITGAAWSPDGARVVYSQFWRRPGARASGADLFMAQGDGSNPLPFAEREAENSVLETPFWAPSGRVYYSHRSVANGRESLKIMRQAEGGAAELLVDNGYSPAVSADETTLVYVRFAPAGQVLIRKTLGQPGEECELLGQEVFQYLSLPRISPDGTRLALAGSGEPTLQASRCGGDPRSRSSAASSVTPLDLAHLLGPTTAYAHGAPADIWSLNLDGSDMRRIAEIKDDDPTLAWSPDGTRLAVFGINALYLVDARGGSQAQKLTDRGGYGGLDWTK